MTAQAAQAAQAVRAGLREELARLRAGLPGVTGALAASVDGLVLAEDAPRVEPEGVAAMVAAALGVSLRLAETTGRRTFRELLLRGDGGYLAVYAAGPGCVLAVLAEPRTNVGRLHLESRRCGAVLAALLDGDGGERTAPPGAEPS